ncbi:quinone-dependent dihydroorotate dehydrogenase [Methyloversatilis sp.]|uniref:quinone-dependent dihydroorotate dehydrogenase n=1 Tax=Methyloversatilis sp. TaxID=2569862 RepID=UPI0027369EA2|nr:quinone-dependent dihydroorotate dehydrogenase [Methyloversatilis sp.]MDP2868266.1 quinone-dependent dihydroorotate dehydrogenase [Methyloversatilis sp.]MDP3454314.1 quinone-dependent dihydroorotate dehydrogenase [Methyloversatilis sp.]MDP3580251.1 quinone-dependent dihydroorotate dehydrogenase [Methyloversatilis sp.]
MLYPLLRPLLFSLDAERAHDLTLGTLARAPSLIPALHLPARPVQCMGLTFPNPVGLAAGLDKNGAAIDGLARLGFGFIEIGTITPRPQPGNPKPRMFRLPAAQGIINRMGFNNLGLDVLIANVERSRYVRAGGILGINIGKNADTPIERAVDDYLIGLRGAHAHASYITVNISSPNTKNLRQLQGSDELNALLGALDAERKTLDAGAGRRVPLALKIAPDLDEAQIDAIADAAVRHHIDALIATNTTLSREGVETLPHGAESGGLSGAPVRSRSTAVLAALAQRLAGRVALIGVGGITEGHHAREKIDAGAQLVQLYSGLIYRGPALVAEAAAALR